MFISPFLGGIFLVVNTTANWTFITGLKRNSGVVWCGFNPSNKYWSGESSQKVRFVAIGLWHCHDWVTGAACLFSEVLWWEQINWLVLGQFSSKPASPEFFVVEFKLHYIPQLYVPQFWWASSPSDLLVLRILFRTAPLKERPSRRAPRAPVFPIEQGYTWSQGSQMLDNCPPAMKLINGKSHCHDWLPEGNQKVKQLNRFVKHLSSLFCCSNTLKLRSLLVMYLLFEDLQRYNMLQPFSWSNRTCLQKVKSAWLESADLLPQASKCANRILVFFGS